jgi:hypothetical protein
MGLIRFEGVMNMGKGYVVALYCGFPCWKEKKGVGI